MFRSAPKIAKSLEYNYDIFVYDSCALTKKMKLAAFERIQLVYNTFY